MISIIMPVKNAMPFLKECLDSILAQNYKHWELLAIDDNSTDESLAVLRRYQIQDGRISVFPNDGFGIIEALQTGYRRMKGEFLTRMDADDIMPPWKLSKMFNALKSISPRDKVVVSGKVKYFNEQGIGAGYQKYENWLNEILINGTAFQHIYKECVIPSPCWMTSKTNFDLIGGFTPNTYPEDYDLSFRFYQHGFKLLAINDLLHYWRDYPSRTSRTDPNYSDNTFLELKLRYFLRLDRKETFPLVLWGAGKKGKSIARQLVEHQCLFHWLSNNSKKTGKEIYGVQMLDDKFLEQMRHKSFQIILTVANPSEQVKIKQHLSQFTKAQSFWFC